MNQNWLNWISNMDKNRSNLEKNRPKNENKSKDSLHIRHLFYVKVFSTCSNHQAIKDKWWCCFSLFQSIIHVFSSNFWSMKASWKGSSHATNFIWYFVALSTFVSQTLTINLFFNCLKMSKNWPHHKAF